MAAPDEITKLPKDANDELGTSGTLIYGGIITQEEYNADLTGRRGNHRYEIMRRSDATVRSTLQVVKLPILSTTWDVDPVALPDGTITPENQEKADFIKRELFERSINWHEFIKNAMTMLDFGFSVFEKVYELTVFNGNTRIGLAKLASRKQVSIYKWETEDHSPGVTQITTHTYASIPREKLVVFTNDREGDNYEGTSLLRYVYKDWDIKDKLTIVNAMALEKQGMGVPVVKAMPNVTPSPEDENAAIDALKNMRANQSAYLKIPNTMLIEMLDMKASTTKDVIPTLNYHDGRIMKSILAGFLELGGSKGGGSHSLSKDLSALFMKSEEALATSMLASITEDIIKQLCDLNYGDMSEGYPSVSFGQISDDDTSALATALNLLISVGAITPDAEVEDHLRNMYRLPLMTAEQKLDYEKNHPPAPPKDSSTLDPALSAKDVTKSKDAAAALNASRSYRNHLLGMLAEG